MCFVGHEKMSSSDETVMMKWEEKWREWALLFWSTFYFGIILEVLGR